MDGMAEEFGEMLRVNIRALASSPLMLLVHNIIELCSSSNAYELISLTNVMTHFNELLGNPRESEGKN